jgi:hypothetical protein
MAERREITSVVWLGCWLYYTTHTSSVCVVCFLHGPSCNNTAERTPFICISWSCATDDNLAPEKLRAEMFGCGRVRVSKPPVLIELHLPRHQSSKWGGNEIHYKGIITSVATRETRTHFTQSMIVYPQTKSCQVQDKTSLIRSRSTKFELFLKWTLTEKNQNDKRKKFQSTA